MALRMIVYTTSKFRMKGGFREVEQVGSRKEGIDFLRDDLGSINATYGQTDEEYLDELNRLGIHVTFEEI